VATPNKVGFVGLGAMGMGMATQLLKKGFKVAAVEVREEIKDRRLRQKGPLNLGPRQPPLRCDRAN
jgi:3-hydroxyisobutyrate dehydrogenase-like beta-hydroxyacid dehydrogenase